jgi:hypothetical protein
MDITEKKQILVVKGIEGFCDRLAVLAYCIRYCIVNDALLCVDWRDNMWGQRTLDFDSYFDLINVNTISIEDAVKTIDENTTYFPTVWNKREVEQVPTDTSSFEKYKLGFDKEYTKINADIVVHNGCGNREWHYENILCNIRFKKHISDAIIERIKHIRGPYTVIHLRGSDRMKKMATVEETIADAVSEYEALMPYQKRRVFVISDMKDMIAEWKKLFPESMVPLDNYAVHKIENTREGTHKLDKYALEYFNITKHDLIMDTLADFIIICFSNQIISSCKPSYFYTMGKNIKNYSGGISRWLDYYSPEMD